MKTTLIITLFLTGKLILTMAYFLIKIFFAYPRSIFCCKFTGSLQIIAIITLLIKNKHQIVLGFLIFSILLFLL